MFYIIFIIFLIVLLGFCLQIFRNDIFSPPIIMLCVFVLCSSVGLLRYNDWNIADYSLKSIVLLLVGILSFICAGFFVFLRTKRNIDITIPIRRKRIDVPNYYVLFSLLFGVIALFIFVQNMKRVLVMAGSEDTTITHLISAYHWLTTREDPEKYKVPARVLYCVYVLTVNSILFLYVTIHNFSFRVYKKKDFVYVLCVLFWPFVSILNSSRYELLCLMAIIVYLLYFFESMYYGNPKKIKRKILKLGCKFLLIFIVLFIFLTIFMGRKKSFSELDVKNYLTIYVSAGIRNFDLFVNAPPEAHGWGKETFPSINRFLYNHFGIGEFYKLPLEYRSINGQNMGNIFTCFRRYYSDFRIFGVVGLSFFLGLLTSGLYYRAREQCKRNTLGFEIILFAYFARCVFFMPIEDYFYIFDVSARGLFKIMVLYTLYWLFIKNRTVIKFR